MILNIYEVHINKKRMFNLLVYLSSILRRRIINSGSANEKDGTGGRKSRNSTHFLFCRTFVGVAQVKWTEN